MPPLLTRALVRRHGAGRADTFGAALLDVAQDHLLWLLDQEGLFVDDQLIFKGGTSLRKCRLGNAGRFSTDLDFTAPDEDVVLAVCAAIDGSRVGGFTFGLAPTRGDGRHWSLRVQHEDLGSPDLGASVEFARRPLILPPARLGFVAIPVHRSYGFDLPELPVIAESEACAEKLARYRRTALARDVYDLAKFASRPIEEKLVRRLWVLKVWADVVDDARGGRPLDPQEVIAQKRERDFAPESIGILTQPAKIEEWERATRVRFQFLADLDSDEQQWARCDPRDRHRVERALMHDGFPPT
jgi:predicted nucleotidyltransferase component of viral defense system